MLYLALPGRIKHDLDKDLYFLEESVTGSHNSLYSMHLYSVVFSAFDQMKVCSLHFYSCYDNTLDALPEIIIEDTVHGTYINLLTA